MDLPSFLKFDFNGWGMRSLRIFSQVNACHDFFMKLGKS